MNDYDRITARKADVQKLYDRFGPKMCLAPFMNSFYSTSNAVSEGQAGNNNVRPCSLIWSMTDWNIQNSSIMESRNTDRWIQLRQLFLDGRMEESTACQACIQAERQGASSPRIVNNEYLYEQLDMDIIAEVERVIANGLISDAVHALDYMPSNYCNYACVMCRPGASSGRVTFEIQIEKLIGKENGIERKNNHELKTVTGLPDADFFDIVKDVKILGFTGGETVLQPEVHRLIDYLVEKDLAKNIIITLLTNASSYPEKLVEKFKKFKRVLYTVSIDGVGDVIEYQRRGADWSTVSANALRINQTPELHNIINYVATGVNLLSAMDFVDWCHANNVKFITVSTVFQSYLSAAILPPELRNLALERLTQGRKRYEHYALPQYNNWERNWLDTVDALISIIESTKFNPAELERFVKHMRREDLVSKKSLPQVVPEWAPWFD